MEVDRICQSVAWLLTQQKPDGHFDEDDPVHHKEMDVFFIIIDYISGSLLPHDPKYWQFV